MLSDSQRERFKRNVAAGVNPSERCGVCGGRTVVITENARYCEECLDFEYNGVRVRCWRCKVEYVVIRRQGCQKDGEEREAAHQAAREARARRAAAVGAPT